MRNQFLDLLLSIDDAQHDGSDVADLLAKPGLSAMYMLSLFDFYADVASLYWTSP
jgi:hypothetical protein